jgi:YVTN family beta-propeller protein
VAQPIEGVQPSPSAAHIVVSINTDGIAANQRGNGSATNIDTSGDSIQGNLRAGMAPAYAVLTPNGGKLYIANSAEDTLTVNNTLAPTTIANTVNLPPSPSAQITQVTGNGSTATYTYSGAAGLFAPGDTVFVSGCSTAGFNGAFTVAGASATSFSVANSTTGTDNPEFAGATARAPNAVFAGTADNNNVYVAGYGTNSVYIVNAINNVVSAVVPVGTHPVALAELPNLQQIYVANQGSGNVSVISTSNNTVTQTIPVPGGAAPVWIAARPDNFGVYVLEQSGTVDEINPVTNTATCATLPSSSTCFSIGAGANSLAYDPVFARLYVTNPTNSQIAVLDGGTTPPQLLKVINLATAAAGVCSGCAPDSVTVLGDGSRAYVGAYQFSAGCTDNSGNAANCVNSLVAVIDGPSASLKTVISGFGSGPADPNSGCGPGAGVPALWQPGTARFRVSVASSGGEANSKFKVYAGQCDAGSVAVIDTYAANGNVADAYNGVSLTAPTSSFPPLPSGLPPAQNPVLVVAGP